jgi:hypothetical protein
MGAGSEGGEVVNAADRELAVRVVDQVARSLRADGPTGSEALAEATRRFEQACPWRGEFGTDRRGLWQREVERALTRLYSPGAPAAEVEVGAGLAVTPELAAWLEARGVRLRERVVQPAEAEPDPSGAEQVALDALDAEGAA